LDIEGNARVAAIVLDVASASAAALVVDAGEHVGFSVWLFRCMSAVVCVCVRRFVVEVCLCLNSETAGGC